MARIENAENMVFIKIDTSMICDLSAFHKRRDRDPNLHHKRVYDPRKVKKGLAAHSTEYYIKLPIEYFSSVENGGVAIMEIIQNYMGSILKVPRDIVVNLDHGKQELFVENKDNVYVIHLPVKVTMSSTKE